MRITFSCTIHIALAALLCTFTTLPMMRLARMCTARTITNDSRAVQEWCKVALTEEREIRRKQLQPLPFSAFAELLHNNSYHSTVKEMVRKTPDGRPINFNAIKKTLIKEVIKQEERNNQRFHPLFPFCR